MKNMKKRRKSAVLLLHTHKYAPELNTIKLCSGAIIPAPNITTMSEAKRFFSPIWSPGRYATVEYINQENPSLNRKYQGYIKSYQGLKNFLQERKEYHNVPGGEFKISITYKG